MGATGIALHPFVPSGPDFTKALRFFEGLGFVKTWEHDGLAGLRMGGAYFLLQKYENKELQENLMLIIEVDNLDEYWKELSAKDLPTQFPSTRIIPPKDQPWGRELVAIDPAGVCWHIRQHDK